MNVDEKISIESVQHVIKRFQKVGFEGLKLEELAIAVGVTEFKDVFMKQTGVDWVHRYELKALDRLRKAHFDMKWMSATMQEEFAPLFSHVSRGDLAKTKEFLRSYDDIDVARQAVDSFNRSPVHIASKEGHSALVDYLLLQGFNVFTRDKSLKTPLHYAAYHGHEYICEQLIKKGALIDAVDSKGRSSFHYSCCGSSAKTVILLIGICPEIVDIQDFQLLTGLHYAILNASSKQIDIVRTLIEFGANVNARDKDGKTPLYYASESGRARVIPILLQKGADLSLTNYENAKTALDVAANDHTRELIIVYNTNLATNQPKAADIQWMNEAIKGQSVKEVPFEGKKSKGKTGVGNGTGAGVSSSSTSQKLKEESGTMVGWVREKFFSMLKKVQEEGIAVNQHLKKPFMYTGSWMESISNVEDLYELMKSMNSTEACLCTFNILCPYDKPLPKSDEEKKELIDNFFGDAWTSSVKKPMEDRLKKELETQEKLARLDDIQIKLDYKDKILKDKIEELKKLRQENIDLNVKLQESEGMGGKGLKNSEDSARVEELEEQLSKLRSELKEKSRQVVEKDMELELARLEGGNNNEGTLAGTNPSADERRELIQLREEMRALKIESKMQRFKAGQIFLKALNEKKTTKSSNSEGNSTSSENLQDDEAIIHMYMALRNNPPNFIQRLKEVDKDGDNKLTSAEFVRYCASLLLSSQDVVSLQRIAGFFDGKQLLGIAEFKTILENRPKQRQIWEERLFRKVIAAIQSRKLTPQKFFELIDVDGSGEVTTAELREGFESLKIVLNQKDFNSLFCIFDKDKNNSISLQEMREVLDVYLDNGDQNPEDGENNQEDGGEEEEGTSQKKDLLSRNPISNEENRVFLQEEKGVDNDEDIINGSLKLQLPTLRNIDPKYKNIYLKISLEGSLENTINVSSQIYNSFIKVAQKFRFNRTTAVAIDRYVTIQIFNETQMNEESYLGEVHFAWKGCLSDPNEWHCNQEFTLLNLSYPHKKVQGFLAVQARFIPQPIQETTIERNSKRHQVEEIEEENSVRSGQQGVSKQYIEQQRKYMALQEQYMQQQKEFMRLQRQTGLNSKLAEQDGAYQIVEDENYDEVSSNIDDIMEGDDYMNKTAMLEEMDSGIDFLKGSKLYSKQSKTRKGINEFGGNASAVNIQKQNINKRAVAAARAKINEIDSNVDFYGGQSKDNSFVAGNQFDMKKQRGSYSHQMNKDLDQLIYSMNSDIDNLLNASEVAAINSRELAGIDSNLNLSQIDNHKA